MAQIDRIVFTTIDRQTAQITVRSFDIPLLLVKVADSEAPSFEGTIQKFTSAEAVGEVFGLEHNAFKMATALLSSSQRPAEFYIAKVGEGQTYQEALMEASNEDNDWYAVVADTVNKQEIEDLARVIQGTKKIFIANTKDADVLSSSVTNDIGSILSEAGFSRTALIYSENADTEFPAAVWVGECITALVGSNTWEYKTLEGVTRSKLSDNQIEVLENKNVNYYIRVLGANVTRRGYMASGEYIDTLIIEDWTNARFQERIFFRKKNLPKIPFTDSGLAIIELEMRSVLDEGVRNGAYDTYDVRAPRALDIPEIERARRNADGFRWEARLAGAVSTTRIRGVVHY